MFLYNLYLNYPNGTEKSFEVLLNIQYKAIYSKFDTLFYNYSNERKRGVLN